MLFYNTVLKTIRVSTSYNSYFGLMGQMYKKVLFLQSKRTILTQKSNVQENAHCFFLFITSYFLFVKIAKFFSSINHCVKSCFGFWPVACFESAVGVYPQLLFGHYRNGFLHQVGHFFL